MKFRGRTTKQTRRDGISNDVRGNLPIILPFHDFAQVLVPFLVALCTSHGLKEGKIMKWQNDGDEVAWVLEKVEVGAETEHPRV